MDQMLERVAGLDVHKKTVTVCVRVPGARGARRQEVRTFGTTVPELLALREWLETQGVTHAAMESTGVYWKPVFYILEEAVTCLLANAAHIARVPGRKTDVQDCVWIAQLVEHGLVRGSFVPPAPIRDLRDLTRARKALSHDRTRAANRLHKVLEDAGIKLASVANDVLGVSGRAMLEALVGGTTDPTVLADLARGKLRAKLPALRHALTGRFRSHHAFLVGQLLAQLDFLEEALAQVSAQIDEVIAPFQAELERLDTIPGVNRRTAEVFVAEVGWICASSRPPNTSPAGPASARAIVRARANTRAAPRARATAGCARPSSRPRYRRRGRPTVRSPGAIAGSCATGATRRR